MTRVTIDSISLRNAGIVTIAQHAKGHRFTLDSLLLADFCCLRPRARLLEIGAGTGVISILLARKYPGISATAVEIQPGSADLCRWNAQVNGLGSRMTVICSDIARARKTLGSVPFDVIIANPPYTDPDAGKRSALTSRRIAREGGAGTLRTWLETASLLKNRGRFCLIYPAPRLTELATLLRSRRLEPKRLRFVHPSSHKNAAFVLIEAVRSAGSGAEILPPLVLHQDRGSFSKELQEIYAVPESM